MERSGLHTLRLFTVIALWLCAAVMSACNKDIPGGAVPGARATIVLLAGPTRAGEDAPAATEDDMVQLRLLIYDGANKKAYDNISHDLGKLGAGETAQIRIEDIPVGRYMFVFVANEEADSDAAAVLRDVVKGSPLSDVRGLSFSSSSMTNKGIVPMAAVFQVDITGDNALTVCDAEGGSRQDVSGNWNVALDRLAIKVNLTLAVGEGKSKDEFTGLSVVNVPDRVYLFEKNEDGMVYDNTEQTEDEYAPPAYRTFSKEQGDQYDSEAKEGYCIVPLGDFPVADWGDLSGGKYHWYKRLILPAVEFKRSDNDEADRMKAIVFRAEFKDASGNVYYSRGPLGSPASEMGYTAPRNYIYEMTCLLRDRIEMEQINVVQWGYTSIEVNP